MADLKRGRIVWVELLDPQGRNPKVRPAAILTPTEDINPAGEIQVVAITGETTSASPEDCIALPWLASGHPKTGLTKPSVAVISWTAHDRIDAIQSARGLVPGPVMLDILQRVAQRGESAAVEETALPPPSPSMPPSDEAPPASQ